MSTRKSRWIDRVEAVREHFENTIFLYVEAVKDKNGKEIPSKYSAEKLQSHFRIREDATYTVSTLFHDPSGNLPIRTETEDDLVSITHARRVGANQDLKTLVLSTGVLSQGSTAATTYIFGDKEDTYFAEIGWQVTKSWRRSLVFSALTFCAAIGTGLIFTSRSKFDETLFVTNNQIAIVVGALLIALSTGILYHCFHKK